MSEQLSWQASDKWCQTFTLIKRIVGGVDYKVITYSFPHDFLKKIKNVSNLLLDL